MKWPKHESYRNCVAKLYNNTIVKTKNMTNALMQKYGTLVYNSYQRLEITWIVREKKYLATPRYNNNLNDIWVYQKFLYQEKKKLF